jgi:hypothetical protein
VNVVEDGDDDNFENLTTLQNGQKDSGATGRSIWGESKNNI